jgi:hypothetical protein
MARADKAANSFSFTLEIAVHQMNADPQQQCPLFRAKDCSAIN